MHPVLLFALQSALALSHPAPLDSVIWLPLPYDGSDSHFPTGGPTWSPDDERVAFTYFERIVPFAYAPRLEILQPDGTTRRCPTAFPTYRAAWSPVGDEIAVAIQGAIVVRAPDCDSLRGITSMGWDPSWSPDGLRIVYNGDEGIETASAAGGDERLVVVDGLQPDWSPDGGSIVFVREGNLWTVSIDGSNERQITHLGNDEWPAWSRDGNHIAFARAEPDAWHRTVWLVGAQGGPEARITPIVEGEAYAYPAWSRDGTRLTYFVLSWATSRIGIAIDRDWMPTAVQPRTWSAVKTRYR